MAEEIKIGSQSNINFSNKQCKLPSKQQGQGSIFAAAPTVAVVDKYSEKVMLVDPYDLEPDMTHGEAVELQIKTACPNAQIIRRGELQPMSDEEFQKLININQYILDNGTADEKTLFSNSAKSFLVSKENRKDHTISPTDELNRLSEEIDNGKKIDAVNFSKGISVNISDLAKVTGLPLTRNNLDKYREDIRAWIKNNKSPSLIEINKNLEAIEKITAKGIPFYIGAGNSGAETVNLFTIADNTTSVGALQKFKDANSTEATSYSADNSLIKLWEVEDYPIQEVIDSNGNKGYDLNKDGKSDILKSETTNGFSLLRFLTNTNKFQGTSFSAPSAVGKGLRNKHKDACGP